MKTSLYLLVCATFTIGGCAQYASVTERRPRFRPVRAAVGVLAAVESKISDALQKEKRDPLVAMSEYLSAAQTALQQLAANPNDATARDDYNFAVARVFGLIKQAKLDPWTKPLRVSSGGAEFVLTRTPDLRKAWNPALYDFTPADQFDINGTYVTQRSERKGLGAPVVAVGKEERKDFAAEFAIPRIYYGVTALIRFDGQQAIVSFEDPLAREQVTIEHRSFPLAADFTVPLAVMLASNDPKKHELSRLLNPEKFAATARIARLQPYDPNKTVVLVVHGLNDAPATWTPLINALRSDEQIRRQYQFWFYSYPSGYPYPYSASILRHELDAAEAKFPLQRPMVVIGHSMGGCISRLLITDTSDEKLWMAIVKKKPSEVQMAPASRKLFTEALIFHKRPEIGRVIFMAAPLRGSDMASGWAGRIGSMLVRSPKTLVAAGRDALKYGTFQGDDLRLSRIPNSVDTLAPNNRFVRAIQTVPLASGVQYNVISGDRGKGGNKDHTSPVMSDGIVPYWSSHLDGAQSELVVRSSHSVHQNTQAIAEVRRLLKGQPAGRRREVPLAATNER